MGMVVKGKVWSGNLIITSSSAIHHLVADDPAARTLKSQTGAPVEADLIMSEDLGPYKYLQVFARAKPLTGVTPTWTSRQVLAVSGASPTEMCNTGYNHGANTHNAIVHVNKDANGHTAALNNAQFLPNGGSIGTWYPLMFGLSVGPDGTVGAAGRLGFWLLFNPNATATLTALVEVHFLYGK